MRMVNIKKIILWLLLLAVLSPMAQAAVPTPVLKWRNGGFSFDDFNKGMYGSPALLDVNQDGIADIVWSNFKVFAFDGATGAVIWSFWAGNDRSSADNYHGIGTDTNIAVADIDGDGSGEIITAHTNGLLCVYDRNGYFLSGFPLRPLGRSDPIESLSVFDLDRDGYGEIIIGWANPNNLNVCVIGHNGAIKPGWPQHVLNPNANALGVFGQNIAVGDIDRDGFGELVVPSDTGKVCAYYHDGRPIPINKQVFQTAWMTTWPDVVNYENYDHEKLGWFLDGYFYMCTDYPATIADVNADGSTEIIIMGGVYTCPGEHPIDEDYDPLYATPFIYRLDRTRFHDGVHDWEGNLPQSGPPLTNKWWIAPLKRANPVVVDIDGDGKKEILSSSYDGKVHCYWLDKSEKGSWPFSVVDPAEGTIRFASEPVVADLDNDGSLEVIFASWPQYYSHKGGHLFILNSQGSLLHKIELPYGDNGDVGELDYDGGLAAPTIGDVDGDGQVEIVLGTVYAGLLVYDLPGAVLGSAPWPTGRHDFARTGWAAFNANAGGLDSVRVLSPNGGENWNSGSSQQITWSSTGSGAVVDIDYSTDNGSSWTLSAGNTANDGSYSWTVPATPSAGCLVRVSEPDSYPSDGSDRVFSISSLATETVSTPSRPAGPASGFSEAVYSYATNGALTNLGHAVEYRFDWDDGSDSGWLTVGTTTASHGWATAGTYSVRATARCAEHVEIESLRSEYLKVIISEGCVTGAYNSPAQYKVLPEVIWASATGGGTWMSSVQVTDVSGGSIVSVYYNTATGRRGPFRLWDNSGGAALSSAKYANLLETIDQLDAETFAYYGTVGAVEFITQDGARAIHAASRTLNGYYAKTFTALSLHDDNTADTIRAMIVANLTNNASYRSTSGFFNPTTDSVTVEFTLLDASSSQVGSQFSRTLAGHEFQAFNPFNQAGVAYPGSSYDNVILRVRPTSGSGKVLCFGATVDNATNDPAAHVAVQEASGHDNGPGSLQILPEAIWATATGGGTWVSEVQIVDATGGSVVSVYFDYGGGSRRGPFTLWTGGAAGSKVKYTNLLETIDNLDAEVFTYSGKVGAVEFQTQDRAHAIQVTARTLNGNYSKTFPGLKPVDAETASTSRVMLIQNYTNNVGFRSTSGFFNPTADSVTVEFTLLDGNGAQIGSQFSKTLAGYDFQAFNPFIQAGVPYPGSSYDNVILRISPTSGTGKVMCFGASVDNTSNDPASHLALQEE